MTDDLNRLRAIAEAARGNWPLFFTLGPRSEDFTEYALHRAAAEFIMHMDPTTALALIDRADPGLWEQMTEALRQRDAARADLAALRAAVTNLAESLDAWADEWQRTEVVEESRRDLATDLLTKAAEGVRSLLAAAPTETEETPDE